ncbi:FAD-dependent oxidoreductase [Pseudonocardia sp. HH130630-07]|uniref:FAD-dependent oxidoreductase n=1 Tax=Pseudonocardia sp. HH130630-07 TaxID=1690815 RepID=UPI000815350E|nr:NAD(P)/FAD-dependent oxidoreductase [Pseudonocardia sp. HH130630-07]ANY09616.1 hypothetical protein AFB00_29070 [Pseudonocardia sp. HH130630-07]
MSEPVLVAGGGVAGCATALGLHRAGIAVEILEARDDTDDGGWFLVVGGPGCRALRTLGAGPAFEAVSRPLTDLVVRDADGGDTGVRRPLSGGDPDGSRMLTRAELVGALRTETDRLGIVRHVRTRVTGVGAAGSRVQVETDRGPRTTPLLIGADGIGSVVRGHVDPSCPPPREVGQRAFYGRTPLRPSGAETENGAFTVLASAAQAFVAIPTAQDGTWWFARTGPPRPAGAPDADPHATLTAALGPDGTAAALLAATAPRDVGAFDPRDLPYLGPWWRGRTVLAGDEAHAASPASGLGATLACEDAAALATTLQNTDLTDHAAVADALTHYQRLRRPPGLANVRASAERSGSPVP